MTALIKNPVAKGIMSLVAFCFLCLQVVCVLPGEAHAGAKDELKTIKYKYYFRGNYDKAITELQSFLDQKALDRSLVVEATEYLAASLILSGATPEGKAQYVELLKEDANYPGPDPSVFKSMIVSTYNEAKAEYASMVIRTVPDTAMLDGAAASMPDAAAPGKPIYKKWWFYATMGAVLLVVGAAVGGSSGEEEVAQDRGTVKVGVVIP